MEVRFTNFRCFKDTGFVKLKKLTFLVGENSSGKTSFLAGINHLSKLLKGERGGPNTPPFDLGTFNDIVYDEKSKKGNESDRFIYHVSTADTKGMWEFIDDHQEVAIGKILLINSTRKDLKSVEIDKENQTVVIVSKLFEREVEALKFFNVETEIIESDSQNSYKVVIDKVISNFELNDSSGFSNLQQDIYSSVFRNRSRTLDGSSNAHISKAVKRNRKEVEWQTEFVIVQFLRRIFGSVTRELRTLNRRDVPVSPLRSHPARYYSMTDSRPAVFDPSGAGFPKRFLRHKHSDSKAYEAVKRRIERFGNKSGLFKKIDIKSLDKNSSYPFSLMIETHAGKISNIMDVGYGVSQVLPLIYDVMTYGGRPTQFLIQQPEVHLHPKAQAEFASLLPSIIKEKCTFLIETHSDFIIDRIKHEINKGTISHHDVGILFFRTYAGRVKIHQMDLNEDGLPIKPPKAYRKFFLEELDRVWP